jgi:hypothetical protein
MKTNPHPVLLKTLSIRVYLTLGVSRSEPVIIVQSVRHWKRDNLYASLLISLRSDPLWNSLFNSLVRAAHD